MTSGISSNSFYWFLCDVGAIHISYFYRAHPGQCNGTFSLVRGAYWRPKRTPNGQNDNFGAIRGCCGSALAEQCGIKVEQVRAHPGQCNGTVSMVRGPVLKIWFGPPNADFWSVWSSQKARKFRQIQPTTKVRILCFEWKRICFQTRDVLCSYNMNYEE